MPIVDPEVQKRDIQEAPIMSFLSDVQFDENKVTIMFNGETYHRKMEQRHIDGIKTLKELMGEYQNTAMLVFEKTPENKVRPTVFRIIPRAVEAHPNSEHILKLQKALGQPKAQYYKFDKAVENATNILENGLDFGDSWGKEPLETGYFWSLFACTTLYFRLDSPSSLRAKACLARRYTHNPLIWR